MRVSLYIALLLSLFAACSHGTINSGEENPLTLTISTDTPYTIQNESELIGGPQADGRIGDLLISNGVIRVIIQQQGKYPGISSFGGNIIDADFVRPDVIGADQFGYMWPLVNVEWTVDGVEFMAFEEFTLDAFLAGEVKPLTQRLPDDQTPVIVVRGIINVYDYLDLDILEPVANAVTGQAISFDQRFDDMFAPFQSFDLRDIRTEVYTEYRLPTGKPYVEITSTFFNDGDADVKIPLGDFLNGSGSLQLLIPGQGFSPALADQLLGDTPAVIYAGQSDSKLSYGYFYRFDALVDAESGLRRPGGSVSYSGVTGVIPGESFPKIFPLGKNQSPSIAMTVPAQGRRVLTRYFVIGDGSAASVLDAGLSALEIPKRSVSGWMVDEQGKEVAGATVAVLGDNGKTIVTMRSDGRGRFSGYLSDGSTDFARAFGSGVYTLEVELLGVHRKGGAQAGKCTPGQIDVRKSAADQIVCMLGDGGLLEFSGPMTDAKTKAPIPVRLTVIGIDPSPDRVQPGRFTDTVVNAGPYGIVQLHYLNARGGIDLNERRWMRLEPGEYLLAYSRGPSYELRTERIVIKPYGATRMTPGALRRVVATPGFLAGDFHIHAHRSPDSGVFALQRVLAASGEGLDVLHSSDHDYLTDYAPLVADLEARGWIPAGHMTTVIGDEITPNNMGHIHAFPLVRDDTAPNGGAFDWSKHPDDRIDPGPDFQLSVPDILEGVSKATPGDVVLQMNHISDTSLSLLNVPGTVTSPAYRDAGVPLLSVYTDPIMVRYPATLTEEPPYSWGTTPFTSTSFTAVEVTIGPELVENKLWETGLPQWFNLLNAGLLWTATGDSDTHMVHFPVGMPRNYIQTDDTVADFDPNAYARAINEHRVVVSAGPTITFSAKTADGHLVEMGETVRAARATVRAEISAPSWAWFDTVEIYANTEPQPVDDDNLRIKQGIAGTAATFFAPYHRPHFAYQPVASFRVGDGTLPTWKEKDGVISATIEHELTFDTDTWVVIVVRGTPSTDGFRPLFPIVTYSHAEMGEQPDHDDHELTTFYADPNLEVPAWAFTNPIFFDVDDDTNGDGNVFESIYVKRGWSPVQ